MEAFNQYSDAIFKHCYYRVSDREIAKDIVQDTFMKAWDAIRKGEEVRNFRPYLYRIANNLIIDQYRKKPVDSLDEALENNSIDTNKILSEGMIEEIQDDFDVARAREAFTKLPDQYREVLSMRFIDDLSIREIAEMLGESDNAVSVRIHRGIQKLKQILML